MDTQNVVIIGGGASGLSAALYLARAGLKPLVLAGSPPGGQLMLTTEVENFPGQMSILGGDLIAVMRKQASTFGATIVDENVKSINFVGAERALPVQHAQPTQHAQPAQHIITLANGTEYKTKAVIIATGAKALWMGLESETRLRGKGVSACATCDGFFFKNKVVAVIGGGDSALEEALTLTKFASKVYLIHRRAEFKASKIMQKRVLEHEKIEVIWNAAVKEVLGTNRVEGLQLRSVEISQPTADQLKSAQTKESGLSRSQPVSADSTIKVDGVFVAIGHRPDTDLFKGQIELDEKGYIMTSQMYGLELLRSVKTSLNQTSGSENQLITDKPISTDFNCNYQTMTSIPGVFGAGDCVDHVYKQASTAAGMGVQASLDAERWVESLTS